MTEQKTTPPSPTFAHKKVQQKTLGARLHALREAGGLTRDDLARRAGVRTDYVAALEEGRFGDLPAPIYARGFLRSVAAALGVRPGELLEMYGREMGIRETVAVDAAERGGFVPVKRHIRNMTPLLTPRRAVAVLIVLALSGAAFYLYSVVQSFVGEPYLTVAAPADGAVVAAASLSVTGRTDPAAVLRLNGQPALVERDGHFTVPLVLSAGANEIVLEVTNQFDRTTRLTRTVYYHAPEPVTPTALPVATPTTVRLTLTAVEKATWVSVRVDGATVLEQNLVVGTPVTFEGREILVDTGSGKRVMASVDGGDAQPLDESLGVVKGKRFVPAGSVSAPAEGDTPAQPVGNDAH